MVEMTRQWAHGKIVLFPPKIPEISAGRWCPTPAPHPARRPPRSGKTSTNIPPNTNAPHAPRPTPPRASSQQDGTPKDHDGRSTLHDDDVAFVHVREHVVVVPRRAHARLEVRHEIRRPVLHVEGGELHCMYPHIGGYILSVSMYYLFRGRCPSPLFPHPNSKNNIAISYQRLSQSPCRSSFDSPPPFRSRHPSPSPSRKTRHCRRRHPLPSSSSYYIVIYSRPHPLPPPPSTTPENKTKAGKGRILGRAIREASLPYCHHRTLPRGSPRDERNETRRPRPKRMRGGGNGKWG